MTTVSSTSATTSGTSTTTASQSISSDAFLKMLVAELKNQDPTSAADPNQMVQQMTSYAQLEQAQNSNTLLEGLQTQVQGLFQAQATNLVGRKVRVSSSSITLADGTASIGVNLGATAADVVVKVLDSAGNTVATLDEGSQKAGIHTFTWNGKNSSGTTLADGSYTVSISAKDSDGNSVDGTAYQDVTVESVAYVNGAVVLKAGSNSYYFSNVLQISE
ncbi:MAG TPA: FlgD immunoglobulin-like domain containing protein [Holophaga sp.]|nr:FlgD immunoglobulin-like domain containing protein [Holophaga sp.]